VGVHGWPLAHALHALPVFDVALNDRLAFAGAFALAMLAALALDAWPRARASARAAAALVVALGLALALGDWRARGLGIPDPLDQLLELRLHDWLIIVNVTIGPIAHLSLLSFLVRVVKWAALP